MTQPTKARRIASGACAALTAAALVLVAAPAFADTAARSVTDIRTAYQEFRPTYSGSPYSAAPSLSAPYTTGSLAPGELQDGLNAINYARSLAGLPADVSLNSSYDDDAQHGAVLLAVGEFAHSQPKPAGMATDFYNIANSATSSSNIGLGYGSLWQFNVGCLGDADAGNISCLGHRRWILNPQMQATGMGLAKSSTDTYVFDHSRATAVSYDSIKWPAAGPFPKEMFGAGIPWSITLNPALYKWTSGRAGHKVTLRRLRDGKTWTFTSADTNTSGEYFNFETSGYGVPDCFIFRPSPGSVGSYQNGDTFEVTLSGGITRRSTGAAASVSYTTQFVSQSAGGGTILASSTRLSGPTSVKCRKTLKLTGAVAPSSARGLVIISKRRCVGHGRWKSEGSARVGLSGGRYKYTFKPTKKGTWRFVATYGGSVGSTAYEASKSATKTVRVK